METAVLFSYPRSGNTWMRYLIEVLSGHPTLGTPDNPNDLPIYERHRDLPVDPEALPAALKRHTLEQLEDGDERRPLILIIRNYKEAILRVRHHSDKSNQTFDLEEEYRFYFQPIQYFDKHRAKKKVFYYEDLIAQPIKTIRALASFLQVSNASVDALVENYERHRGLSLANYDAVSGSHTLGEAAIFHSLNLTAEERGSWDDRMEALEPACFHRYLSRYRETLVAG